MIFEDWGVVEYEASSQRQLEYIERVAETGDERLVFVTHPPVVTLGRATSREEDLIGWSGSLIETSRGGRATYHGPNQIVIYPMIDLRHAHAAFGERDVHAYLRALEGATVTGLRELGLVNAESRTAGSGDLSLTGVWVGEKKIASVGIAVRKWITYHGVAINVLDDPSAHQGIRPCGFSSHIMTSVERELGKRVDLEETRQLFRRVFQSALKKGSRYFPG